MYWLEHPDLLPRPLLNMNFLKGPKVVQLPNLQLNPALLSFWFTIYTSSFGHLFRSNFVGPILNSKEISFPWRQTHWIQIDSEGEFFFEFLCAFTRSSFDWLYMDHWNNALHFQVWCLKSSNKWILGTVFVAKIFPFLNWYVVSKITAQHFRFETKFSA